MIFRGQTFLEPSLIPWAKSRLPRGLHVHIIQIEALLRIETNMTELRNNGSPLFENNNDTDNPLGLLDARYTIMLTGNVLMKDW